MQHRILLWAALAAFLIDQISKYIVVRELHVADHPGGIDVLPPLLTFKYGENRGINFGLLQGDTDAARWVLTGISLAVCLGVLVWLLRTGQSKFIMACGGMLVGGAVGNVVDRVLYGYVLDFLNMSCCGINNPFVFNFADVFIFAGALGLLLVDSKKAT
ncbi:MAG: signal peptidase II [Ruegeria sp.]